MKKNYKAKLQVNKVAIELNEFTEQFLANVTVGAVTSLKGVEFLKKIEVKQDKDDLDIKVNGEEIKLTPFPNDVIANTFKGLVSTLKGVDKSNIKNIDITIDVL